MRHRERHRVAQPGAAAQFVQGVVRVGGRDRHPPRVQHVPDPVLRAAQRGQPLGRRE
jgi:hypothetical protein